MSRNMRAAPARGIAIAMAAAAAMALAGCSGRSGVRPPARVDPDIARADIAAVLPANLDNRFGWAVDIHAAFEALQIEPTRDNTCAVVAITAQETGFRVDPPVPGLAAIARRELEARAASHNIPKLMLNAALTLRSRTGVSYRERLDSARTERDLSELFEDFIDAVPLGKRLLADFNPVRTAGPMQVGIAFAEQHAAAKPYPYPHEGDIRSEVFTRRGGMYFGIAHLLDYTAGYDAMLFRFADYNAGHYASRNAGFQSALSTLSGTALALDGDLLQRTELAARKVADRLGLSEARIHADLAQAAQQDFDQTRLYLRVFELADARQGRPVPRAVVPVIRLASPKITRKLTTDWFARRVDQRYQACRGRVPS